MNMISFLILSISFLAFSLCDQNQRINTGQINIGIDAGWKFKGLLYDVMEFVA